MTNCWLRSLAKWGGIILEVLAALWLLGWLQGNDPDCILETGVFAQIRICDPQVLGETPSSPLVHIIGIAVLFLLGLLFMRLGSTPTQRSKTHAAHHD